MQRITALIGDAEDEPTVQRAGRIPR
jgi:hypothetical protein